MKKVLSMLLSVSMVMSAMTAVTVNAQEQQTEKNVVWIGGSYAAGAGHEQKTDELPAGVTAQPFAKTITEYLDTVYDEDVKYTNVAIGGTTSEYGMARFERDVISKNPDMVFIEFTGNDYAYSSYFNRISIAVENMVRRVQTYEQETNKDVDIVFFYRPLIQNGTEYNRDQAMAIANVYKPLADYYDIYELDPTESAKTMWEKDGVTKESMTSADGAHPTALGHYYIGEASKKILEKAPITHQSYRTYPMNLTYNEIQPVWKTASENGFYDSAKSTGCTVNEDNTVTIGSESTFTFNFKGQSVCVENCYTSGSGTYQIMVDGVQITNGKLNTTNFVNCLGAKHTYSSGNHVLTIKVVGEGSLKVGNIAVDDIANGSATARETYNRAVYTDDCTVAGDKDGRTISGYLVTGTVGSTQILSAAAQEEYYPLTYNATSMNGFSTDMNIHNVEIEYYEYNPKAVVSEKGISVIACDGDGKKIEEIAEKDIVREWNGSNSGNGLYKLKVIKMPENTKAIKIKKAAHSSRPALSGNGNAQPYNISFSDVKIGYAVPAVESISMTVPYARTTTSGKITIVENYTDKSSKALGEGDTVTYSSSNEDIATVDESGTISFKNVGNVIITATATIDGKAFVENKRVAVTDMIEFTDTPAIAKPANLTKSDSKSMVADWFNAYNADKKWNADGKYLTITSTKNDEWNLFRPLKIVADDSNNAWDMPGDKFKDGGTYVVQMRVRKSNTNKENTTPYFGMQYFKNGISNPVGTKNYGTTGMAVTSTEWTDFKDTITFTDDYSTTQTGNGNNYNALFYGISKSSTIGSAVDLEWTGANSLYIAEEVPFAINLTTDKEELAQGGDITVTSEVVNQINIPGNLSQDVKWYVVSQDRSTIIDNVTTSVDENKLTVSCDETLPTGIYTVVAYSEKYDIVKGIEIEVVTDLSVKYADFVQPKMPETLVNDDSISILKGWYNAGNADCKDGTVAQSEAKYVTYTANDHTKNAWNVFACTFVDPTSATAFKFPNNCFRDGATYALKVSVRKENTDDKKAYFGMTYLTSN